MMRGNLYRFYRPDFAALAKQYPTTFGQFVGSDRVLDWGDPAAVKCLTQTLLLHDFQLVWDMPLDRLCPPLPNRLNYICWLSELMKLRPLQDRQGEVRGVDIGTGASCIYPLLGERTQGWKFLAVDTDATSIAWATKNVAANALKGMIEVHASHSPAHFSPTHTYPLVSFSSSSLSPSRSQSQPHSTDTAQSGPLSVALSGAAGTFDFSMTNPPFFGDVSEAGGKPSSSTSAAMTEREVACEGGEVAFVGAIIEDSIRLKDRVRWCTTMLGKKGSLSKLASKLRSAGVTNVRAAEFCQGRIKRWGLGWSFTNEGEGVEMPGELDIDTYIDAGRKKKIRRGKGAGVTSFQVPTPGPQEVDLMLPRSKDEVMERLQGFLEGWKAARVQVEECEMGSGAGEWKLAAKAEGAASFSFTVQVVGEGDAMKVQMALAGGSGPEEACVDVAGRVLFQQLCEQARGEVLRQNRKWTRIAKAQKKAAAESNAAAAETEAAVNGLNR
ncbi:unnamed protein product [Chrysoparadoxa australica]